MQDGSNLSSLTLANYSVAKPLIRNCSPQFSLSEKTGLCSPICDQWKGFSEDQVIVFIVTIILSHVCHIIGTIVALLFSCYNHRLM